MKKSELSAYIATLLLKELRDSDRNLSECEKILHDSLELLKNVTLDNSILQMKRRWECEDEKRKGDFAQLYGGAVSKLPKDRA